MALPIEKARFTFADYCTWSENKRIELLEGEPVIMAPPSRIHQEISMELSRQLSNYLEGKQCKVYAAPFSVRLFATADDTPESVQTVFEPDITVICDQNKMDHYGCKGAPEMIIEILSPITARHDRLVKFGQYQKAGVLEYWIVSPEEESVQVFLLNNGQLLLHEVYGKTEVAKVNTLDDCFIELKKVFPQQQRLNF